MGLGGVISVLIIACIPLSNVVAGNSNIDAGKIKKESAVPEKTIEQVHESHAREWMSMPGVEAVGIGLCKDKPCIKIYVSITAKELKNKIPAVIDGYPISIEQTESYRVREKKF